MNLSHENNYMLSLVSVSSETSNVGVVLNTPKHTPNVKDLNLYQNGIYCY